MQPDEQDAIARALGVEVIGRRTLTGGFSHETSLVTLADGQRVVARLGGTDPAVEAAVMAAAGRHVPVPRVLCSVAGGSDGAGDSSGAGPRALMVLEYVSGTLLSEVLAAEESADARWDDLGAEVGRVLAAVGRVAFDHPGFFTDSALTVALDRPWSQLLPEFAASCMAKTPGDRLDSAARAAWVDLCAVHAPSLTAIDGQARLAHADANPKNILVSAVDGGWRVDALLDWEFSYSGSPYADAANMLRFSASSPDSFCRGFRAGFAAHQPADLTLPQNWLYLGHVHDMFALSDLGTRPSGHVVADQAADLMRGWLEYGIPD